MKIWSGFRRRKKYDFESRIKRFEFFQHHYYQLKFISVIQLSKLFGANPKNDRRSFYILLSLLEKKGVDYSLLFNGLEVRPPHILNNDEDLFELAARNRKRLKENVALIKKVVDARNQIYAHKDPFSKAEAVLLEDIHTLIFLARKVHDDINFCLFHTTTRYETRYWGIDYVLKVMSKHEQERIEAIERKKNPL